VLPYPHSSSLPQAGKYLLNGEINSSSSWQSVRGKGWNEALSPEEDVAEFICLATHRNGDDCSLLLISMYVDWKNLL
jgi:hypothetical protein